MKPKDEAPGPLAGGWESLLTRMLARENHLSAGEIELMRLMFYAGARLAITAADGYPLAIVRMKAELRDFDAYVERCRAALKETTCRAENIS